MGLKEKTTNHIREQIIIRDSRKKKIGDLISQELKIIEQSELAK